MKMNKLILALFAVSIFLGSCKKKFDLPPAAAEPAVSGYITIDSIVNRYGVYYTSGPTPTKLYRFVGDVNLECTVTADETSGNIYKTVFVEDATGALTVKLLNSGGLLVGDKIRINLNNVVLNDYGGMVQLDSIDIEKRVRKISSGNVVTPTKLTFNQLNSTGSFSLRKYQARLVILDTVEFSAGDKGTTFADPINKFTLEKELLNSAGNSVIVRNSGYANFAGSIIPCGKGSVVAILGEYNGTTQLTIRDHKEVKLTSGGCPLNVKSFNDASVTSGGWSQYNVSGAINWTTGSYNGETYGYISNYVASANQACESWFISPSFNISAATNPRFSFNSAYNYSGPVLEVLVSTNYTSGNPTAATWTPLSPTLSPGSWNWTNSGIISLSSYMSTNTRIAFKYTGTGSSGSTWEIDDIAIFGE